MLLCFILRTAIEPGKTITIIAIRPSIVNVGSSAGSSKLESAGISSANIEPNITAIIIAPNHDAIYKRFGFAILHALKLSKFVVYHSLLFRIFPPCSKLKKIVFVNTLS